MDIAGIEYTHPQYDAMVGPWQRMADVCTSESYIHGLGERYIPRLSGQSDDQFDAYVRRASFVAFTKRCIEAFHGMVMRKDVHVDGFTSINIDGEGSSINKYVSNLVKLYLKYGRCGTLVDMPIATDSVLSVADEIERNIFPRLLFYSHANILDWSTEIINNIKVLSYVKLREKVENIVNGFRQPDLYRYRILDLTDLDGVKVYRQRVYDDKFDQIGEDIFPKRGGKNLKFIPFYIHGGLDVQYPPLLPVAEQNIHHYMLDADYKHGLHFVAIPTPWCAGVSSEDKPKSVGPTTIWAFEDPNARCGMLEFTGAGLSQFNKAKEESVEIIVTLASRVIAPEKSSNDESALAASIRSNAETSSLAGIVDTLSEDICNAIRTVVWWSKGDPSKVTVEINKDFIPSNLSGTDVLSYVTAWIKGSISYTSLFWMLKRGEIIRGDRTLEDELKDITEEQKNRAAEELKKQEQMAKIKGESDSEEDLPDPTKKTDLDKRVA